MRVNDIEFEADCFTIVQELQSQLHLNKIQYLGKIIDTPNNVQICCPYHNERRPSAGIRKSDGLFHCFACGEVHSLQEVISFCFGYDDPFGRFGWEWLIKNFAAISIEERKDIELDLVRGTTKEEPKTYVSEEELDEYRYYHPYWSKRGITDSRIIELFDLGYDKKTDCITMPVRDVKGNVLFVARRSVKTKFFNYPKDVDKPLYGLYEVSQHWVEYEVEEHIEDGTIGINKRNQEIFICESMIDALLLWQSGFYALALNGLGSSKQIAELKKLPTRKYILCTDNDEAGRKAREVLRQQLRGKLITEIDFPSNRKDVGECTKDEIDNILDWEIF